MNAFSRDRVFWLVIVIMLAVCAPMAIAGSDEPSFVKSQYDSEKVVAEEFSLKSGAQLRIDVDDMDIYVKKTDGQKSRVEVFVAGPDRERALEFFNEHLNFEAVEDKGELRITSQGPRYHDGSFWRKYRNVDVWAIISVPASCDADITTNDGDLRVDDIEGDIKIRTDDGDIEIRDIRGPSIDIKSSDGDIVTTALEASEELLVSTSDGDIEADRFQAKRVSVKTSDGDIVVEHIEGEDLTLRSSDGDIEVGVSGGDLSAECSDGDMRVNLVSAMSVDLRSRDGDIDIIVPESLNLDVELKGDDVSVRGGKLTKGNVSQRGVVGSLNSGGPLLRAKSNDGTVALRLR